MRKVVLILSFLLCVSIFLCGCADNVIDYEDYKELEADCEEYENEINSLEEHLDSRKENIKVLLNYIKTIEDIGTVETYSINDVWSVEDYFDFMLTYDKECKALCYDIKSKEGKPIAWIDEYCLEVQKLFVSIYRSDGYFESYDIYGDGDITFLTPDYNYSYELVLFAYVNDNLYRANFNISCEDIEI